MKTLHLIGHRHNWNLDAHFKNGIGDGFIFCAYSFQPDFFTKEKINKTDSQLVLEKSSIDLQYFGKKESGGIGKGNLSLYPFHPAADQNNTSQTNVYMQNSIINGIKFQTSLGLNDIIIPNYYENEDLGQFVGLVGTINKWLKKNRVSSKRYFMTIPITYHTIIDAKKIDDLLYTLTDIDIEFDGYYIICEPKPDIRQKINIDFKYLRNLSRVFEVLKKQKFITIYSYANWDALIFLTTSDIDYITIATYENLRSFSIKRFLSPEDGGPSKGWYYSEKLLNFIKAPFIELIRQQNGIEIIKNEKNIFSDIILEPNYPWSNQKADVHKNYLLSIDRTLKEIGSIDNLKDRKEFVLGLIDRAIESYNRLEAKNVYFQDESKNYHLGVWKSYLLTR